MRDSPQARAISRTLGTSRFVASRLFLIRLGSREGRSLGLTQARILSISATSEMAVLIGGQPLAVDQGMLARVPSPAALRETSFRTSARRTGRPTAPSWSWRGAGKTKIRWSSRWATGCTRR